MDASYTCKNKVITGIIFTLLLILAILSGLGPASAANLDDEMELYTITLFLEHGFIEK
ncbi:MAG: hypothetical protein ACI9EW_002378 [Cellvibrionaceae bacterium]|jgi:hypothetical protein